MEFYYIRLAIEWIIWLVFADKNRWREILPVCFFASLISLLFDHINELLGFWKYLPQDTSADIFNTLGIYIVSTYLFIQWLPKKPIFLGMIKYWFIWTAISLVLEYIHAKTGHMIYLHWCM